MPVSQARNIKFRTEIEGLRGLLVLLVMLYHTGSSLFAGAFFSVDIFFLLSGYLMVRVIEGDVRGERFSIVGFYERRARRIFPALFVYILAALVIASVLMPPAQFEYMAGSGLWAMLMAGNFYFIDSGVGYFSADMALQPFMHFWSLGLEQQYYLFIPLLFTVCIALRRPQWVGYGLLVVLLTSFWYSLSIVEAHTEKAYYSITTRAWEFAAGSLMAYGEVGLRARVGERLQGWLADVGMLLLLWACFFGSSHWAHPGYPTLVPVIGGALFILLANQRSLFCRILSLKPLMYFGGISLSLYIGHQIVFALARWYSLDTLGWPEYAVLMVVAVVLATLTYRWVEVPGRDRRLLAPANFWVLLLSGTLLIGGAAYTVQYREGIPERFPERVVSVYSEAEGYSHKAVNGEGLDCYVETAGGRPCPIGSADDQPRRWLLVGDSHAAAMLSALDVEMRDKGVGGYAIVMGACAYSQGSQPVGSIGKPCRRRNDWVREFAANERIAGVILVGRYQYYLDATAFDNGEGGREIGKQWWYESAKDGSGALSSQLLLDSFVEPIRDFLDDGMRVVLTYPVPEMGWNIPNYYYKSKLRGVENVDVSVDYDRYRERVEPVTAAFDRLGNHPNLHRVDPSELLCDIRKRRCSASQNGRLLYFDDDHLNPIGARMIAEKVVREIESFPGRVVSR